MADAAESPLRAPSEETDRNLRPDAIQSINILLINQSKSKPEIKKIPTCLINIRRDEFQVSHTHTHSPFCKLFASLLIFLLSYTDNTFPTLEGFLFPIRDY